MLILSLLFVIESNVPSSILKLSWDAESYRPHHPADHPKGFRSRTTSDVQAPPLPAALPLLADAPSADCRASPRRPRPPRPQRLLRRRRSPLPPVLSPRRRGRDGPLRRDSSHRPRRLHAHHLDQSALIFVERTSFRSIAYSPRPLRCLPLVPKLRFGTPASSPRSKTPVSERPPPKPLPPTIDHPRQPADSNAAIAARNRASRKPLPDPVWERADTEF